MGKYNKQLELVLVVCLAQSSVSLLAIVTGVNLESTFFLALLMMLADLLMVLIAWRPMGMINLPGAFSCKNLDFRTILLAISATILGRFAYDMMDTVCVALFEHAELPDLMEDKFTEMSDDVWGLLVMVLIGPIMEELIFREAFLGSMLRRGDRPYVAILISALCFGIIHLNPAQIPSACMAGLMLGYVYYKTGSAVLTSIMHILNNFVACVYMWLPDDGASDMSDTAHAGLLGECAVVCILAVLCGLACIAMLRRIGNRKLALMVVMLPFCLGAQDLTHEVDADTVKWPVPQVEESWKLEYMPHNNANHNVYVYKDKLYDALFTRTLGWNGGDGVQTTILPDGNVFWTFNDSFYGRAIASSRARGNCNFPRNTIMVQTPGTDGLPGTEKNNLVWLADWVNNTNPSRERYYHCRTHLRHPKGEKTDAEIASGDIDQQYLYWAGDGTVVDGQLQVLWAGVYNGTSNLMQSDNRALAIYSLEGAPGDPSYLSLVDVNHNFFEKDPIGYGQTLWEDEDGHTYLYACNQFKKNEGDLLNTSSPVVARSATHDLRSKWEYYIADADGNFRWQDTYPTAEEVNRSAISSRSVSTAWVFKDGDYYYMTAQGFVFGKQVYIMRAEYPWGPFEECHQLWTMPWVLDKKGVRTYQHFYMPHLHQSLSREGELVFSTNTDTKEWGDNFNSVGSADFYRPFFFRIYNWKAIFDE